MIKTLKGTIFFANLFHPVFPFDVYVPVINANGKELDLQVLKYVVGGENLT